MMRTKHLTPPMIGRSQFPGRNHHPRDLARSCFRIIPLEAKSAQISPTLPRGGGKSSIRLECFRRVLRVGYRISGAFDLNFGQQQGGYETNYQPKLENCMKKILLGAGAILVAVGIAAPASAADIAPRYRPAPPPMVAAIYDWSGFYIGANGGWGSSHKCWDLTNDGFGPISAFREGCHDATGGVAG